MKVTDLMVGDWVLDGTQIAQITSITFGGVIETTAHENSNIEVIEPIPLTAEILVKNGWIENPDIPIAVIYYTQKFNDGDDGLLWDFDVRIDCDPYGDYHLMHNGVSFCYVNYVHELQHALRLCGITREIII